ncbi:hypothetical protein GQX74_009416 [Glossina fuscipes]|nr:hypothetical protein GQX74_009416 [Glossina fuscipes]
MEALDRYSINTPPNNQPKTSDIVPRSKEEKEVFENFSAINPSLQIVANYFLANPVTSPLFATVLSEYFLCKMHEMHGPKSPLYDLIGHVDKVLDIDWSNRKYIASGGADNTVRV